jgi:hypothetical protein
MKVSRAKPCLIVAVCAMTISFILFIGLLVNVARSPGDWISASVYMATVVGFAAIAVGACLLWARP